MTFANMGTRSERNKVSDREATMPLLPRQLKCNLNSITTSLLVEKDGLLSQCILIPWQFVFPSLRGFS